MDGVDRVIRRKRSLKERLGLKGIGCCGGATWASTIDDDAPLPQEQEPTELPNPDPGRFNSPDPGWPSMNLAEALAAERHFRSTHDEINGSGQNPIDDTTETTPLRVSLMRLLEETDGGDLEREKCEVGSDPVCCVCMGRNKGAAFIPCGHTFCRVCSRELWLNRGSCPLCNRPILEILDIF